MLNDFLYFSSFNRKKCLKSSKCVIAFWILFVTVWKKSTEFALFRKDCVKLKGWNDIFIIKNSSRTSGVSPFHVTYIACCKKFVDFQIDLFVKTDSFPLGTVDSRYSWARTDVDFDYETDNFLEVCYNTDDDSDSNE